MAIRILGAYLSYLKWQAREQKQPAGALTLLRYWGVAMPEFVVCATNL